MSSFVVSCQKLNRNAFRPGAVTSVIGFTVRFMAIILNSDFIETKSGDEKELVK